MSYGNALLVVDSESSILIEACLADVRKSAGLDDEVVLPSLRSLVPPRIVGPASVPRLPLVEAKVGPTLAPAPR